MIYVYVLKCERDGLLYTGCTRDLRTRMGLHNRGRVVSTAERRPLRLIYYEACLNEQDAFRRERYLKTTYGKRTSRRGAKITSRAKEGFERTHLPEKIRFYNVARGSAGEVRSLLYVAEDNFKEASAEAKRLRVATNDVGRIVTGLLGSTNRRRDSSAKGAILALFGPISYLLSASFF